MLWRPDLIGWRALSSRVLTDGGALRLLREPLCMYVSWQLEVIILGVLEYFLSLYHSVSIFLSFPFLISNQSFCTHSLSLFAFLDDLNILARQLTHQPGDLYLMRKIAHARLCDVELSA
jgi:hypothetical protein